MKKVYLVIGCVVSFLSFFISRFTVSLADQFLLFVVPIMVYQKTQSVAWSSLSFALETIPRVFYTPIAGIVSDKRSPLKTVKSMMLIRLLLCVGAVGVSAILGEDSTLIVIIGLSALVGLASTQSFMSSEVLLPITFKEVNFARVQSWTQSVDQMAIVIGPMLAATVLELFDWSAVILVAGGLFLVGQMSFSLWVRKLEYHDDYQMKPLDITQQLKCAFQVVVQHQGLLNIIAQTALVNLLFGSALATAAAMVTGKFNLNASSFGFLQMMGAITSIGVLTITALIAQKIGLVSIGRIAFTLICFGGGLYALGQSYWVFFIGFIVILGFDGMFNVYIRSLRQKVIPVQDYGKATGAIVFLNNITKPLSGLIIGALGFWVSVELIILAMVSFSIFAGIVLFKANDKHLLGVVN